MGKLFNIRTKVETILIFILLVVISINSVFGTVTITDTVLSDDTLGIILSFDNDWLDIGNITTSYLDYPEIAAPGVPGADTMRLFVEDSHGFSVAKSLDNTSMKRALIRDSVFIAKNVRGSTIAAARIVYATGSEDDVPTIDTANASSLSTMPAIGVTLESIANDSFGRIMQIGLLENVNTNAYNVGDVLYVSPFTAGVPTSTIPVTPNLIQEIGTILVKDQVVGAIQIVARAIDGNEFGTINDFIVQGNLTVIGYANATSKLVIPRAVPTVPEDGAMYFVAANQSLAVYYNGVWNYYEKN